MICSGVIVHMLYQDIPVGDTPVSQFYMPTFWNTFCSRWSKQE